MSLRSMTLSLLGLRDVKNQGIDYNSFTFNSLCISQFDEMKMLIIGVLFTYINTKQTFKKRLCELLLFALKEKIAI